MAGKKAENIEESGVVKGKNVTCLTNKVPLIDANENVLGICGVSFDITRQKKMEKALKDAHLDLKTKIKESGKAWVSGLHISHTSTFMQVLEQIVAQSKLL